MSFGDQLKKRREELGLSRAVLAARLGISASAISTSSAYISAVSWLGENTQIPYQGQRYSVSYNSSTKRYEKIVGICNAVAGTQLLNRRLAYDMGESFTASCAFSLKDVITTCGCTVTATEVDFYDTDNKKMVYGRGYAYSGGTASWYNETFHAKNGAKYNISTENKKTFSGITNDTQFREYLASLLLKHPEGVYYYGGGHAILFTHFLMDGSNIVFYAIDGVNVNNGSKQPLEYTKTWQYKSSGNGVQNLYNNVGYIAYINDSASTPGTGAPEPGPPEMPVISVEKTQWLDYEMVKFSWQECRNANYYYPMVWDENWERVEVCWGTGATEYGWQLPAGTYHLQVESVREIENGEYIVNCSATQKITVVQGVEQPTVTVEKTQWYDYETITFSWQECKNANYYYPMVYDESGERIEVCWGTAATEY